MTEKKYIVGMSIFVVFCERLCAPRSAYHEAIVLTLDSLALPAISAKTHSGALAPHTIVT